MKRLYFLIPNVSVAEQVVAELHATGLTDDNIHTLAKEGTPLTGLPEAGYVHKSDVVPALKKGAALGGATGLLAGLAAIALPGVVVAGGALLLASTLGGATLGAWASSLVGAAAPSSQLEAFEEALKQGQILMLVDLDADREDEISNLIRRHHPEVEIHDAESADNAMAHNG